MKRVQTILAKVALIAVVGIGLSACVAAVPAPVVPASGSVAVVPGPAVPAPGYYYAYPGYYYPPAFVAPNVGLSFAFHGGHGFHR